MTKPQTSRLELLQGTLDLLILEAVALELQHGWAKSERVQQSASRSKLTAPGGQVLDAQESA